MNIPNLLTVSRIVLSFVCVALILKGGFLSLVGALAIFLGASFTDFLDGFLARKKGNISDLGKLLDPIADKVLILGVLLAFLVLRVINIWMIIIIMTREFIITGVRLFALNRGQVLEAKKFGKHKTLSQMVGINFIFIVLIVDKIFVDNKIIGLLRDKGIAIVMWYVVLITTFSGIHYLWANRKIIRNF